MHGIVGRARAPAPLDSRLARDARATGDRAACAGLQLELALIRRAFRARVRPPALVRELLQRCVERRRRIERWRRRGASTQR